MSTSISREVTINTSCQLLGTACYILSRVVKPNTLLQSIAVTDGKYIATLLIDGVTKQVQFELQGTKIVNKTLVIAKPKRVRRESK